MITSLLEKEQTTRENRVWVRIAAACNEKCLFCLDADAQNGKLISDDIIRSQIQKWYHPWKYNRIIISGGEASIHPKFSEYIAHAKSVWYDRIQTVTNGNMFARKEFCDRVVSAGLDEVTFSLHGHTARLHDYLTATPGSFDKALRGLLYLRKFHPHIIINIDIVVCRVNVDFLPDIVWFFMRLGIMEYDILQIIPFGRWFSEFKNQLFYEVKDKLLPLHKTWELSRIPGMHMWTNRFPVEAFEWYEDLIQDPRKIKSETMGETYAMFDEFIKSRWTQKPTCYGERCDVCFLKQYCHDFIEHQSSVDTPGNLDSYILLWEEFPSQIYEKYGPTREDFLRKIRAIPLWSSQEVVNIPRCIRAENNDWKYTWHHSWGGNDWVENYTKKYIMDFYRKKSLRCRDCRYFETCEWIHINYLRAYGFQILQPIS